VLFGPNPAFSVNVVSDTQIIAQIPNGVGTVNVTVQSGQNETDNISSNPNANVNAPIFGYGTSASTPTHFFTFVPPTVAGIQVNGGTAQRSEVHSLAITFSAPVVFAGGSFNAAAAFQLEHVQDSTNIQHLQAAVTSNLSGQTVVTLSFTTTGNAAAEIDPVSAQHGGAPSLADGRFQLTIFAANVTGLGGLALNNGSNYVSPADTLGGGSGQLGLYRIFGDSTGNGIVDQLDLAQFQSTNNASVGNPVYISYLDADNSGVVDQLDLAQFRIRFNGDVFGPQVPGATPPSPGGASGGSSPIQMAAVSIHRHPAPNTFDRGDFAVAVSSIGNPVSPVAVTDEPWPDDVFMGSRFRRRPFI
jgi:hypothetical protein